MCQKVYGTKKCKNGTMQVVPNKNACCAIPKSVLLVPKANRKEFGLTLQFPHGHLKFNKLISDKDMQGWSQEQRFSDGLLKKQGIQVCPRIHAHMVGSLFFPDT